MPVIEPKFTFLQMKEKLIVCQPIKFCKPSFCKTSKWLDSIHVGFSTSKFIL